MTKVIDLLTADEERLIASQPETGFIAKFESWAGKRTDASPYALKAAALMALSLSAGDVVALPPFFGSKPTYLNLYALLVGPSTTMRKTTVLGYVRELLPKNEGSGEDYIKFMDDVSIQAFARDIAAAGETQTPVLLSIDEVAGLFQLVRNRSGSYLAGFDKTLMKAYDHEPIHIARVGANVDVTQGAFVGMFAASTPEPLLEILDGDDVESGLLPRFMISDGREAAGGKRTPLMDRMANREDWSDESDELREFLAEISNGRTGPPTDISNPGLPQWTVHEIPISTEALERLDKIDEQFSKEVATDDTAIGAIKGRAFWHIVKIAGLQKLSRSGLAGEVELIDVLRATWLVEATTADLALMRTQVGANLMERRMQEVEGFFKEWGRTTLKQSVIARRLRLTARELIDLGATLKVQGKITVDSHDDGSATTWKWRG